MNKSCLICGNYFKIRPCLINIRKTCSHKCSDQHQRNILTGRKYSEEHKINIGKGNIGKIVSEETKQKIRIKMSGAKNWNWKGGDKSKECIICNIIFKVHNYSFQHAKYCSQKCMYIGFSKFHRMEHNPNWKGGRYKHSTGYIRILKPDHPFSNPQGYIFEHRFIMEQNIGRYLKKEEAIHHINEIKHDNRIENLILFPSHGSHKAFHHAKNKINKSNFV